MNTNSFCFAVFGDCRPRRPRITPTGEFKRLVKLMAGRNFSFAVGLGDYIYSQFPHAGGARLVRRQLAAFKEVVSQIPFPCYLAPGNHDVGEGAFSITRAPFERAFRELISPVPFFSFNHRGSHFILLNSELRGAEGLIMGRQRIWLLKDLLANKNADNIFVFMHRPVFDYEVFGDNSRILKSGEFLRGIFRRFGVRAVFVSHVHTFHVTCEDGVTQILTGSAGDMGTFPHFVSVSVEGKKIKAEVVPLNGKSY